MKNFLLLVLLSFISITYASSQCEMTVSSENAIIPAGETNSISALLRDVDFITGIITPITDGDAWNIVCTGCASSMITSGGDAGNAGVLFEYVAGPSGSVSITFSVLSTTCGATPITETFLQAILPIELAYFKGEVKDSDVNLNWLTTMELNNDFFTVERSFDGKDFTSVSKIAGAGDSEEDVDYTFSDENVTRVATANTVYYRLKQTDFDGAFTYSDVIAVNLENRADLEVTNVTIAGNELSVNFVSPTEGNTEISVYDLTGRMIATSKQFSREGYNTTNLDLNTNQSGIFIVRITDGQTQTVRKIVK